MKQKIFNAISVLALAGCSLALVTANGQGPLGPFATRLVKADSNGALHITALGACSTLGPFTLGSSVLVKADSNGALQVCGDNLGGGSVDDTAYGISWNGVTDEAPSKNAVYDKIETVLAGGGLGTTDIDTSAEIATIVGDETGTSLLVFNTSPTFATSIIIGSAGVSITEDGDGALTFLGRGNGSDEDLTLNFDDTANTITVSSSTSVANIVFTSIDLSVADEAYDATNWNGSLEVPTKNAVRDILETFVTITDPNADYILFWDDSDGAVDFLSTMTGLTITGNTLAVDWAATKTLTETTFNVESSGNVFTDTVKFHYNTAVCQGSTASLGMSGVTALLPTATCHGTNVLKGYALFPDSDGEFGLQGELLLPADWTGAIDFNGVWRTAATSGDIVLQISIACTADAEVFNDTWDADVATVTETAKGTTLQLNAWSLALGADPISECAAGELLYFRVYRQRTHASDSLTGTFDLGPITVTARRAK